MSGVGKEASTHNVVVVGSVKDFFVFTDGLDL